MARTPKLASCGISDSPARLGRLQDALIPAGLNILRRLPVVLTQVVNSFYATNNLVD